ncbi:TPA: hypothetical protein ACQVHK_005364, partial [Serratia marcescens]
IKCWKIELFEEPKPSASIVNNLTAKKDNLPFFTGYSENPVNLEELRDEQFITIHSNPERLESSTFRVSRIHEVKCSPIYEVDNSFDEAAKPLIKWLAENVHPHHTAIVDQSSAELLMGLQRVATQEFVKD